jgi:hypothetical protein
MNKILFKRVIYLFIFCLFLAGVNACITPFDPKINQDISSLVIEGQVSNLIGADNNLVTVTYSSPFNNENKDIRFPKNLKVYVTDNLGNKEPFIEGQLGKYLPQNENFHAKLNRSYTLHVETPESKKYESKPELMKPVAPIDTVYLEYKEKFDASGVNIDRYFDVIVETKDLPSAGDLYKWDYLHYEQLKTCKADYIIPPGGGLAIRITFPCCDDPYCYDIYRCLGCINLGSDNLLNGNKLRVILTQVNYDKISPFYLLVNQGAISRESYKYWQLVKTQVQNSGGIFDTPPAVILGNISNLNDPKEQVLGFFSAINVAQKAIYLDRSYAYLKLKKQPFNFAKVNQFLDIRPYEAPDQPDCKPCLEGRFRTKTPPIGFNVTNL